MWCIAGNRDLERKTGFLDVCLKRCRKAGRPGHHPRAIAVVVGERGPGRRRYPTGRRGRPASRPAHASSSPARRAGRSSATAVSREAVCRRCHARHRADVQTRHRRISERPAPRPTRGATERAAVLTASRATRFASGVWGLGRASRSGRSGARTGRLDGCRSALRRRARPTRPSRPLPDRPSRRR